MKLKAALNFLPQYLREVRQEAARVTWPDRQQTLRQTGLVIAASLAVGAYIGILDLMFTRLLTLALQ